MNISIRQNLEMLNANNQYQVNTAGKAKATERLSSGYRINRAADDAAGLKISEKMRAQIRGLKQGTRNAEDGVSWTQVGDGALEEVHAILQRMRELTIQSLNDTNTTEDRAACQEEFDQLQSEIDRITKTTQFNTQDVFYEHESPYYQAKGNQVWGQSQQHAVVNGKNDLVITYRKNAGDPPTTATITVPPGQYTTQELVDEIDDALEASGLLNKGFFIEFTEEGTCNINFEGGELIDSVSGGLSYLLYDTYEGGEFGALIGTTVFVSDTAQLEIGSENNYLEFKVENFDGASKTIKVQLANGYYTKDQLIEELNKQIKAQGASDMVEATSYGSSIKLAGKDSIVTGFKGNMFKIDDPSGKIWHSVFYDNVKYADIHRTQGEFIGGAVISPSKGNEDLQTFQITTANNKLTFLANDAVTPIEIEIPAGEYTLSEMVTKLNDLFKDNDLELDATIHASGSYKGIKITSTVKGNVSQVGLDKAASSAYDTLFVERRYNVKEEYAEIVRNSEAAQNAQVVSRKEFLQPLTIDNTNNQFVLRVDNRNYTITLDNGACNSASDLQSRIQDAIDKHSDLNGKLTVSATASGCMKIEAKDNSMKNVNVYAASGNNGYQDIFVKTVVTKDYTPVTATGGSSLRLDETLSDPVDFTDKDNTLDITINGKDYTVTFPVPNPNPNTNNNTYTQDEIKDIINEQIKNQAGTVNKTFQQVSASGHAPTDRNFNLSGSGTETKVSESYNEKGETTEIEGVVGKFDKNEPAKVTFTQPGNYPFTIDNTCNQLQLNINGVEKSFTLDEGIYTNASALAAEIQDKIQDAFGTNDYGGATVTVDAEGKLVLTAGLKTSSNTEMAGSGTTISCSTATSTFLEKLHTVKTPASVTSTVDLQPSITLNGETLTFSYEDEAGVHPVSVSLSGTYDREKFVEALNQRLPAGVRASLDGARLKLETTAAGTDTSISFDSNDGGTAIEAMFGNLTKEAPASATASQILSNPTVVNKDNDKFEVTVNGQNYTLTLDHPTDAETSYKPAQLVAMLNQKLEDQGIGLTATLSGNRITYTTTAVGAGASFSVEWIGTVPAPGVTASISGNKLTLTGTENGSSISVKPKDDSVFQKPKETKKTYSPESVEGHPNIHAAIDGVDITEPVNINKYNNTLSFSYYDNGTPKTISISFDAGELKDYKFQELESALQAKIDAKAGAGKLTVTVTASGVRIEVNDVGSGCRLDSWPSGGFYDRVLCSYKEHTTQLTPTEKNGTQTKDAVYTVGQKDVVSKLTNIRKNINDTLSLDFTCTGMTPSSTISLSFQLDQGLYTSETLKNEIQKKLNEALAKENLPENLIEVGIGGVTTTTSGSNNNRALVFKLSESVRLPADGEYVIDGVGGSAAFSVFYRTDGELDPAYLGGSKDISNGVTIGPENTDLKFKIDDKEYSVTIPQGTYSADGIVDTLTDLFKKNGVPAIAERSGDYLRIVSSKMGNHKIYSVSGGAKYALFCDDEWNYDPQYDVKIQNSGNVNDYVEIKKPVLNTCFLRINTVTISKPKYAEKALVRLDYAINKVSEHRSEYGAMNNRLEHIISNNQNMEENTQQAESRIRDADMAKEVMNQTKYSILEQAAQAMMAQAKQTKENVVRLLEV